MAAKKGFTKLCLECNTKIGVYGFKHHSKTCHGLGLSSRKREHPYGPLPPGRKRHYYPRGKIWNKGLTKETDVRVKKGGETFSLHYKEGKIKMPSGSSSPEGRAKISEKMCDRIARGAHIGRCKKVTYTSPLLGIVNLHGTWELAVARFFDLLRIKWIRNTKRFKYINLNGRYSYYIPDFYLETWGLYIEVKGYETELDRCKWKQFPLKLVVWKWKEVSFIQKLLP